ncbi:MAG: hypothetical protein WDW36_006799 [Sanguina aurantia]
MSKSARGQSEQKLAPKSQGGAGASHIQTIPITAAPELSSSVHQANHHYSTASSNAAQRQSEPQHQQVSSALQVHTVAANLKSQAQIRERILAVTRPQTLANQTLGSLYGVSGSGSSTGGGSSVSGSDAGALLCVSGSHPFRTIPLAHRLLPGSLDTLSWASQMRDSGEIPETTQLWAVGNPNTEPHAALLEQKVSRGATTILTQPPFDQRSYEAWIADIEKRQLLSSVSLLIGIPMISSAANLAFWLELCGCSKSSPASAAALAGFAAAEAAGKPQAQQHSLNYNRSMVQMVTSHPGIKGLHMMPITPRSKKMVLQLMEEGLLPHSSSSSSAHTH